MQAPSITSLARIEISGSRRRGSSSEILYAEARSSYHYKRIPLEPRPSLPPRCSYVAKLKTIIVLEAKLIVGEPFFENSSNGHSHCFCARSPGYVG
ncbi:hypothetical protein Acr_27g0006850 [Actinidia rufa]|uniref:Uncharacterized protein n=1 Tax=Actinidia rufa TaxID=165716 RepID=A0A7J0H788_9ERIC|nr:hypothetical protein Acr_27g0006850 [Actinidia rufa]